MFGGLDSRLVRECMAVIKWFFKILFIGFRHGWGYFVLGGLITISLLNGGANNFIAWIFTPIGLIISAIKIIHNNDGKIDKKKAITINIIVFSVFLLLFLIYSFGGVPFEDLLYSLIMVVISLLCVFSIRNAIKLKKSSKIIEQPTLPIESLEPHGVVFGRKDNYYIVKPEDLDGHVLVVGGVGSGKSSCIAIPTLRGWNESVFAIDIKGELYEKTKDYRPNIKVFESAENSV